MMFTNRDIYRRLQVIDLSIYAKQIMHDLTEINGRPLPTGAFIAGDAVANLIFRYEWGGDYPVGDIDIFTDELYPETDASLGPLRTTGYIIDEASQHPVLSKIGYRELAITRQGLISKVPIRKTDPVFGAQRFLTVLSGFDLNYCMVGIDTFGGRLYWTKAFEKFLHDGQLQVTCPVTPYQTTIRLAQKERELGCYVNLREEIDLLMSYMEFCELDGTDCTYEGSFPARKYLDGFLRYREKLSPFCHLVELTPPVLPGLEPFMDSRFALEYCDAGKHHSQDILELLNDSVGVDSYSFIMAYNHMYRSSSSQKTRERFVMAVTRGGIPAFAAVLRPENFQSELLKSHLNCIERFGHKHPACLKKLLELGMTIREQCDAIRLLQTLSRKIGDIIYRLVEHSHNLGVRLTEISEPIVESLLDAFMVVEGGSFVEPVNLESFKYKDSVRELTTSAELYVESSTMRHCISSYAAAVKSGECRVFHISRYDRDSTAAIYQGGLFELYGPRNSAPPHLHVMITRNLARIVKKCFERRNESRANLCKGESDTYMNVA